MHLLKPGGVTTILIDEGSELGGRPWSGTGRGRWAATRSAVAMGVVRTGGNRDDLPAVLDVADRFSLDGLAVRDAVVDGGQAFDDRIDERIARALRADPTLLEDLAAVRIDVGLGASVAIGD